MKYYCTYLRVSTQKQGKTMLGIEAQRKMCQDFVNQNNGNIKHEFMDIESGTHRDRKGLQNAIMFCKKNGCPLVIAKLDRLARDVEFCFKVINTGIEIHFCDMPTINTLLLGVFASVAQYERELTSDRTRKALAVKKANGCKLGASSDAWKDSYYCKTYEERRKIGLKKGASKNARYLESKEVKAFVKVLRSCFPEFTKGDVCEWQWQCINTKGDNKFVVLKLMKDYNELDSEIFSKWCFSDDAVKLQVRLASFIKQLRTSIYRQEKFNDLKTV